jgi:hypothetical protein
VVISGADGTAHADINRLGQALDALGRVFTPGAEVAVTVTGGDTPTLTIGPVQPVGAPEETARLVEVSLHSNEANESVGRPGGWAVLVARHLIEGQGGALVLNLPATAEGVSGYAATAGMGGATLRVRLAAAR